jgi:hypothetical protein
MFFVIQRILQKVNVLICVIAFLFTPKLVMAASDKSNHNKYFTGYTQISQVKSFKKKTPFNKAPSSQRQLQQTSGPPYRITTETLTITGKGSERLELPFSPKRITTETLTITGLGDRGLEIPFTPKHIRTETLTITGMGTTR